MLDRLRFVAQGTQLAVQVWMALRCQQRCRTIPVFGTLTIPGRAIGEIVEPSGKRPAFRRQNWREVEMRALGNSAVVTVILALAPTGASQAQPVIFSGTAALQGAFTVDHQWSVERHPRLMADVNGDGRADIVGFGNDAVYVSLGQADGRFGPPFAAQTGAFAYNVGAWRVESHPRILADVNGDGRADIVGFAGSSVLVALGQPDGRFSNAFEALGGGAFAVSNGWTVEQHPRFLVDVDGDGRADIVGFGNDGVWVARGQVDGRFGAPYEALHAAFGHVSLGWQMEKHPRLLADVDGDGRADIVGFGENGVWVARGQPDGRFSQAVEVLPGAFSYSLGWYVERHPRFLADVNGDGRADIVGFSDNAVWVALGQVDGSFAAPFDALTGTFGYQAGGWRIEKHPRMLADVNGDGRADIVGFADQSVMVALGQPDGHFSAAFDALTGTFGYQAGGWRIEKHPRMLADVNGDGRADIVGFSDNDVQVAVSFTTRQTLWEFWRDYRGADKVGRLLDSYAVGLIQGAGEFCTGTMISPHILLTAAHCGGPDRNGFEVRFFHTDEEAPGPAPQFQSLSQQPYFAHSFPWARFVNGNGIQDSDFMLWWLENGPDRVPPGIRYGQLELSTNLVGAGDRAYSFWWNPYDWVNPNNPSDHITFDTLYHSLGEATSLGGGTSSNAPSHFTDYNIWGAKGGSGSSVLSADAHTIIGVTALSNDAGGNWRRAADTGFVLSLHDGNTNGVLDAVEYDLLTTGGPQDFRMLRFDTPLQRAQWRPSLTNGQVTLAKPRLQGVPAGSEPTNWVGHVGGARIGPLWYRHCTNSPWNKSAPSVDCAPRDGFYLENFEDGLLNVRGVTASAGAAVQPPGAATNSVDLDDGVDDHNGNAGHSFSSASGATGITFSFNETALGSLPKRAGLVWTDGEGETTFEAFDAQGGSMGAIGPVHIASGLHNGTDVDDRFFGFSHQGGISAIKISNSIGGIQVDHLQYEVNNLPNAGDSLEHANIRFAANATYRIAAVVYGLSSNNNDGTIAFTSASGGPRKTVAFETAYGGWKRVSGRVTLGDRGDYRLALGAPIGGSFYISSIAIVREASDAVLNFETAEERASWEYVGGGHPTSWGMNGAGDFSGMVTGPSPSPAGWSLRQRNPALEAHQTYEITYDVKHVRGALTVSHHMRVENLSGVQARGHVWQFTQNGQTLRRALQVSTDNESGNALVFGSSGDAAYLVDNIRIRRVGS